jgi:hypothetical protein
MFGKRCSSLTESQKHFTSHLSRKRSAASRSSHLRSLTEEDLDNIILIAFFRGASMAGSCSAAQQEDRRSLALNIYDGLS